MRTCGSVLPTGPALAVLHAQMHVCVHVCACMHACMARGVQGVLFPDRMKPAVLDTVRPELLAMEEAFIAAQPSVKVQRLAAPKVNKGFGAKK